MAKKKPTNPQDVDDCIRRAYNEGQETVTIDGFVLSITLQARTVRAVVNGASTIVREEWLIAKSVEHYTPLYSIERVAGGNLRSAINKVMDNA